MAGISSKSQHLSKGMFQLRAELRDKWLKALRSGEYEQTIEVLHDNTGYCCLGVLCDISGLGEWDTDVYLIDNDILSTDLGDKARDFGLDGTLAANLVSLNDGELEDNIPGMTKEEFDRIREQHDARGLDFNQIADYIERMVPAE